MRKAYVCVSKDGDLMWASFDQERAIRWAMNSTLVGDRETAGSVCDVLFDEGEQIDEEEVVHG